MTPASTMQAIIASMISMMMIMVSPHHREKEDQAKEKCSTFVTVVKTEHRCCNQGDLNSASLHHLASCLGGSGKGIQWVGLTSLRANKENHA